MADMLEGDGAGWLVKIDGQTVGFSMVILSKSTVCACFIRPDCEGRGIGRRLMEAAETELRRHGIQEAWLTTGPDLSIRANGFYQALGWQPDGYEPDGQIWYVKRLGDA
jgi:GNAT superfamily N-acetyltransferase